MHSLLNLCKDPDEENKIKNAKISLTIHGKPFPAAELATDRSLKAPRSFDLSAMLFKFLHPSHGEPDRSVSLPLLPRFESRKIFLRNRDMSHSPMPA